MALSRRSALVGAALLPLSARAAGRDMSAVVRIGGQTFTFEAGGAEDMGSFASPAGFRQSCLRRTDRQLPLTVYFRADESDDRLEVVFELGRIWQGRAANLGPYRVEIRRGDKVLARDEVPQHFWFSRWRWQSAPRPIVVRPVDLRGRGLIPRYARPSEDVFGPADGGGPAQRYRPMTLAGIEPHMETTGERGDIGLVTEHQARFLCTEAPDALATLRAQAEGAGTLPWHIRDERTGAPVNLDRHGRMSWYGNPGAGDPHVPLADTGIGIDSAHQPALAYVPYLLTGDPYHLEDLQFAANFNRGLLPPDYRLSIPQPRAFAWSLRTLAQAARVTPDMVPSWLLPAKYFRADLDRTRQWFEAAYVRKTDPLRAVFRATDSPDDARDEGPHAPGGTWISPWQHEFVAAVLGWAVLMGFDEWRAAFTWAVGGTLARTSERSGWSRAYPSPYRLIIKADPASPVVSSWEEAWRLSRLRAGWRDADHLADEDLTSSIFTRGALAVAVQLGIADARAPLTWITEQLLRRNAKVPYKWRLL